MRIPPTPRKRDILDNFDPWWGGWWGRCEISWGHFQPFTFHCSFSLEPHELCAGLRAQAAQSTPARAQWHQSSVAQSSWLQWHVHSAMLPSAAPRGDWYPKLPNTFSCHWIHGLEKRLTRTLLGRPSLQKKAWVCLHTCWYPSRKHSRFFYKLKDVFILTQSRLQIPAITTSQLQSQDIITRHPCLPLGEFFSNATMRERNVMEVPPTPSATPHWYFILVLFLLPTQQIWLFQLPSQKHSKPQFISSGHFLRLQNWDTVQCNPGTHPLRTDQAEVDAVPTEQHIMTAVIDFPQPNSAVLKSPVSGGAVAKDDTSKRFFAWHERCWMVARLGSSTSP